MAMLIAWRTRLSLHGFPSPLMVNCSTRGADVIPLMTVRFGSLPNVRATSPETSVPSIAPERSAATRALLPVVGKLRHHHPVVADVLHQLEWTGAIRRCGRILARLVEAVRNDPAP